MFTAQLTLAFAQIKAITHKMTDGSISGRVTVRAHLTEDLAGILECKDLTHLPNGAPRTNFEELALTTGCKAFRAVFEVEGLRQSYEMDGDEIGEVVIRPSKGTTLMTEMRLSYHGDPLQLISYWMHVGAAEGTVKIVPLQTELEAASDSKVEIVVTSSNGKRHVEKIDKATVREAVLATRKDAGEPKPKTFPIEEKHIKASSPKRTRWARGAN